MTKRELAEAHGETRPLFEYLIADGKELGSCAGGPLFLGWHLQSPFDQRTLFTLLSKSY